jgi:hypothetical protein
MINSQIIDGKGSKNKVKVNGESALYTIQLPYPPIVEQKTKPFRQYFTDDGTTTGSNDMGVDGSSANQDFYIAANTDNDIYITSMNFIVGYGASGSPFNWADGTALTNGTRIFYENRDGEVDIHNGIKTNQDLFRLSFSTIQNNWEVRGVNANNDYGYFISSNLSSMGLSFGIKLDRGSKQRLTIRIRDNAGASADSFNCIAYGFERFE